MAITTKPMPGSETIHVDLNGPDGNAFSLMALAQKLAKQLHDNLLEVFDKHFGEFVILHK